MRRKKTYRAHRRNTRGSTGYTMIPLVAMAILLIFGVLNKTGSVNAIEEAVIGAAQNEKLSQDILQILLPENTAAGDVPPLVMENHPAQEENIDTPPEEDEPVISSYENEDTHVQENQFISESIMPEIYEILWTGDDVTAITISGDSDGYVGSGNVYLRNETKYDVSISDILKRKNTVSLSGTGVEVLIMHTHGTEAYTPDANNPYIASDTDRTLDESKNVIRVGEEIANILTEKGINVVHSTTLNDYPSYNGSYVRALDDISTYLRDNPSIKVVIDVHRDAMVSQSGVKYKTVAEIDGKSAAQIMLVSGTDEGGQSHSNWRDNLAFHMRVYDRMNTEYPGIMRPILLRPSRFNQHATTGSMLVEVGTSGNSLDEALYSARLFAEVLGDMLLEGQ